MAKGNGTIRKVRRYIKDPYFWIVFLMLLCMGSMPSIFVKEITLEIGIILCSLICIKSKGYIYPSSVIPLTICIILWILIVALFTGSGLAKHLGLLERIILSVVIISVFKGNFNKLKDYLYVSLWVFTIHGAINFLLYTLFTSWFQLWIMDSGAITYTLSKVFYVYGISPDRLIQKNPGIFWEPGVFQIHLNLLIYLILIVKREPYSKAKIPMFVLLTTMSTTGLVILVLTLFYRLFYMDKIKLSVRRIPILILALLIILPIAFSNLKEKLSGESTESAAARTYDLLYGIYIIKNNPLFGIGYNQEAYNASLKDISLVFYDNLSDDIHEGNTNTIIQVFMFLGIPMGVTFVYCLYHQRIFPNRRLFFIIYVLSILSEPMFSVTFTWLLILSSSFKRNLSISYRNYKSQL